MRNHSNENEFDLHENGPEGETHLLMNGCARRLVLKQRQMVTRKWPITFDRQVNIALVSYWIIQTVLHEMNEIPGFSFLFTGCWVSQARGNV